MLVTLLGIVIEIRLLVAQVCRNLFYLVAKDKRRDLSPQIIKRSIIIGIEIRTFLRIPYHRFQSCATRESILPNTGDAITNCHQGHTAAIIESTAANTRNTVTNRYRGQSCATIESIISNACDAIRDSNRTQTGTTIKSTTTNARNAIGNSDRN